MTNFLDLLGTVEGIAVAAFMALASAAQVDVPPKCDAITLAQVAPQQDGVPEQQWCCCGSCCNWAISCEAIPGCGSC